MPTAAPNAMEPTGGISLPRTSESAKENVPAHNPLTITMKVGSAPDTFLARLLSKPQRMVARTIMIEPGERRKRWVGSNESMMMPRVMMAVIQATLLPMYSLKTIPAIKTVAEASKFRRREDSAADLIERPIRSETGARIPPSMMEPAKDRDSFLERGWMILSFPDLRIR